MRHTVISCPALYVEAPSELRTDHKTQTDLSRILSDRPRVSRTRRPNTPRVCISFRATYQIGFSWKHVRCARSRGPTRLNRFCSIGPPSAADLRMSSHSSGQCDDPSPPDVVVSHAGEHKFTVVDHVRDRFAQKHPSLHVYVDEWSLKPGARAMEHISGACRRTHVNKRAQCYRTE